MKSWGQRELWQSGAFFILDRPFWESLRVGFMSFYCDGLTVFREVALPQLT